jgi:hypothetical protein
MRNSALLRGDDATEVYCPPARSASPPDDAVGNGQLSHDRQLRHGLQRSDGAILIGIAAFLFAAAFVAFDRLGIHRNASGSEQRVQRRGHSCRVPLFLNRRDRADIQCIWWPGPYDPQDRFRDIAVLPKGRASTAGGALAGTRLVPAASSPGPPMSIGVGVRPAGA